MSTTTFDITLPTGVTTAFAFPFQARDPQSNCERGDRTTLLKGVIIDGQPVTLELQAAGDSTVTCRIGAGSGHNGRGAATNRGGEPAADAMTAQAGAMVRRLLGFAPDPLPFDAEVARNLQFAPLRPLVAARPGQRIPQTATVWEALAWAIIGQQINLPFAFQLRREMVRLAGRRLGDDFYAFPTPADVAALDYGDLQAVKYSRRKAEYLIDTARLIVSGDLPAEQLPDMPFPELEQRLLAVRGIGPWTVNYVAMRGCAFTDCVPVGDTGLTTGLMRLFELDHRPGPDETLALMAPFAPYRSFVTFHLWQRNGGAA